MLSDSDALQIETMDLEDFYASASDLDKANLYFVLLNSFNSCLSANKTEVAAHLSFLMAYYIFMCFCPPASNELALYYIKQSIALHSTEEYEVWLGKICEGN